jgi:undecaprenyl-phosphate 4-deoxy-4-formamido-L-arabinose transferase
MNCSVVVPVYRGEATLDALAERLGTVLPQVAEQFEVIFVNDDSPDRSWEVISRLSQQHSWIRGISLTRNYGQENATLCGIMNAEFEIIATMDDDLQHSPEELPQLLSKLAEGYDLVYGVPRVRRQAWWKSAASTAVKRVMAWSMGMRAVRDISAFKVFRAELRQGFRTAGPDVFIDALLTWVTLRTASSEIEEAPRLHGRSNYSLGKLIRVALLVVTNYTTVPLRLASITGFVFTILGFFVLLYVVYVYFALGSTPGFPFLVSVVAIFSGVELFAIGIIGEYLARVFERSSGKPMYTIRTRVGGTG